MSGQDYVLKSGSKMVAWSVVSSKAERDVQKMDPLRNFGILCEPHASPTKQCLIDCAFFILI